MVEWIDGLSEYLSNAVYTLVYALLYILIKLFTDIGNIIIYIFESITGLFTSIYGLMACVYNYIGELLTIFPSQWSAIMLIGILIYTSLRLWNLIWGGK